ncbi:MAG TPA: hypothetical protein VK435_10755 [Thermodesulfovibrionales bacterium]|nr:hypothetical protein [Thermodesulfovibrionales bacterium]
MAPEKLAFTERVILVSHYDAAYDAIKVSLLKVFRAVLPFGSRENSSTVRG